MTIRRLLTLQGTVKPHQIISLMKYDGTENTLALGDHADHIDVGFDPISEGSPHWARSTRSSSRCSGSSSSPAGRDRQPDGRRKPSKYAIPLPVARASTSHRGE